jgi:hypothetical protein
MTFAVATSIAPNYFRDRISYEDHDRYFLIKVETVKPPDAYDIGNFILIFDGRDEWQTFLKGDKFRIVLQDKKGGIIEDYTVDELLFETFIENNLYIIRINEELLKYTKYDNWRLS